AQAGQHKCLCCGALFDPDHRNRTRQRYCVTSVCRTASKAASQASWLAQSSNQDYFRDPMHVRRVQAWRADHPGYSRGRRRAAPALQDRLIGQADDLQEESCIRTEIAGVALQDPWNPSSPVLVGLIAHLFEVTLQDDIASTTRRLVQLGLDVMNGRPDGQSQEGAVSAAAAADSAAVQLA
ncbi:MAG: hypothetical protein ACHQIO_24420, partial [Nevskiales bacterium]